MTRINLLDENLRLEAESLEKTQNLRLQGALAFVLINIAGALLAVL